MRAAALLALLSLVVALPRAALADDDVQPAATVTPAPVGAVPLMTGDVAPNDGILLPEEMFISYKRCDIRAVEAELKVEARDRALAKLEENLALAKTPQPKTWWERHQFQAGAAAMLMLIIGGAQAIEKFR